MSLQKKVLACVLGGVLCAPWIARADGADPALTRFIQAALDASPQVRAAQAALDASGALKSAADRPLYNPELTLEAEDSVGDVRTIGLSQTLDWGGKRSARTLVAESERLATEAEYYQVRWAVILELLEGLADHQTAIERSTLAQERVRLMTDFATLAQRRFDAGDLNQVELDLATLVSLDARMQRAAVGSDVAAARQQVRNLVPYLESGVWPSIAPGLPQLSSVANDPQVVLTLPEVRAARRRLDAAAATVDLRKRERRPDPTLSLTGGEEEDRRLIGLSVSIPLPIRNGRQHQVTAASAEYRQAEQLADDVLQRARARFIGAAERYRLSHGAWRDWTDTGKASLDRQGQQLQRLWEAGELSTTDYLVQLQQTLDVQGSALALRQSMWRAWFEWLAASGRVDSWVGETPR